MYFLRRPSTVILETFTWILAPVPIRKISTGQKPKSHKISRWAAA